MSKKQLILIGGGGHCKSVIEALRQDDHIDIIGILDSSSPHSKVLDVPVIGDDSIINDLINQHYQFLITVGNIGYPGTRVKLFDHVKSLHGLMATLVAKTALVAESAHIDEGTMVMQNAMINAQAVIGRNCIINTKALIEHEALIGDHVHVATGAIVNGQCRIGNNCFIGSGAVIGNNVTLADNVIIGAGSVVIKDILTEGTYVGNPAKIKK